MIKKILALFVVISILNVFSIIVNKQVSYAEKKTIKKIQTKEKIVYVTRTGRKYHDAGCGYLRRSSIPMSKNEAEDLGYTPCSKCW